MRLLIVLIVLVAIALVAWGLWTLGRQAFVALRNYRSEWEICLIEDTDRTAIWLVKGYGDSIIVDAPKGRRYVHLVGAVDRDRDDYYDKVMDLEVEAEQKRDDWNNIQKALKA